MSDDFYRTVMGRKFYEGTMPRIATTLEQIYQELKRFNGRKTPDKTPSAGREIHLMLALSTSHVSSVTADMLRERPTLTVYEKGDYGWFVPVLPPDQQELSEELYGDLVQVMNYARVNGFTWIMFDCDVVPINDLPHYDW